MTETKGRDIETEVDQFFEKVVGIDFYTMGNIRDFCRKLYHDGYDMGKANRLNSKDEFTDDKIAHQIRLNHPKATRVKLVVSPIDYHIKCSYRDRHLDGEAMLLMEGSHI